MCTQVHTAMCVHMCVGAYVPMCVHSEARAGGYLVCPTSSLSALRQGVSLNLRLAVLGRLPSQRVLRACTSPASLLLTQALEIQTQVFMLAHLKPQFLAKICSIFSV